MRFRFRPRTNLRDRMAARGLLEKLRQPEHASRRFQGLAMVDSAPGPHQPTDAAEELRQEALKVQKKLRKLLEEVSELIDKTKQLIQEVGPRRPPSTD
jgi:hypothetical protein